MEMKVGAPFELVWRNDELTDPPGERPEGFGEEHRMQSRITELDPPRKISFTWQNSGDVTFELAPQGDKVLLTVIHRRLPDRDTMLMVGPAGTCISTFWPRGRAAHRTRRPSGTAGCVCRRNTSGACRRDGWELGPLAD